MNETNKMKVYVCMYVSKYLPLTQCIRQFHSVNDRQVLSKSHVYMRKSNASHSHSSCHLHALTNFCRLSHICDLSSRTESDILPIYISVLPRINGCAVTYGRYAAWPLGTVLMFVTHMAKWLSV